MDLLHALRLDGQQKDIALALVGAGGKTTTLFQLGREILSRAAGELTVLLSASTHLGVEQTRLADFHYVIEKSEDITRLGKQLPPGVVLCTGPQVEEERTAGLPLALLDELYALAKTLELPLLIEADGSRRKPLKAPSAYEPPIPLWANVVVVVAGLSGLGQALDAAGVHRPERFAELSGLALGQIVTPEALAGVLAHPLGGLKNIPSGARRVALLNQVDDVAIRQLQAQRIAGLLLGTYHAVLAAALDAPGLGLLPGGRVQAVYEPAAGILLAAGGSSRLGQPKQLLEWRGEPLVRHVACTALQSGLTPVVVVTGAAAEGVQAALDGLPVLCVHNPDWAQGQSSSLIKGLEHLPPETGAVVFLLSDQPQVPASLVRSLVELHTQTLSPLVAPLVDGRRANPVLFDRTMFPDLHQTSGDVGGRVLFARYPAIWLPWHDRTLCLDVDTPEDYARLLELEK